MGLQKLYNILLLVEFIAAFFIFILLFFISAPYGRYNRTGWGPTARARVAWIVMELPAVLVIAVLFFYFLHSVSIVSIIFLILWEIHYLYRTFIYPFRIKGAYKPFPLLLVGLAFLFNTMNGYINGYYLFGMNSHSPASVSWLSDSRFIIGVIFFFSGLMINIQSDAELRKLRKTNGNTYQIPYNSFFKYVSSPNYMGEICEWFGWALLTWSLAGLAFAVFTFANLAPRAYSNHKWYNQHFPDYPEDRKILIPFIF